MTSGRSGKKVMWRKPSASHCVQKFPPDLYRPSNAVFSCGLMRTTAQNRKGVAGGLCTAKKGTGRRSTFSR